jgi:hypothetical protein
MSTPPGSAGRGAGGSTAAAAIVCANEIEKREKKQKCNFYLYLKSCK